MPDNPSYRLIEKEFLNRTSHQGFTVFVKEYEGKTEKFVKFADQSPEHQKKLKTLLMSGTLDQPLYIHKDEKDRYLSQISNHLKAAANNNLISHDVVLTKLFCGAREMIKDVYSEGVSKKMVDSADVVVNTIKSIFSQRDFKFEALAKMLANDGKSYTHGVNVTLYCLAYGTHFNLDSSDLSSLGVGALFHDLGIFTIPENILAKEGLFHDLGKLPKTNPKKNLAKEDVALLKNHPTEGKKMLESLNRYPSSVLKVIEQHHENYDGTGYPQKLSGNSISYLARICKVADTFDTLRNPRTYRLHSYKPFDALKIMVDELKGQFDPKILKNFILIMGSET